ncbi:hypothetical protein EXIGLDRAFT_693187 [Exidia glandulosa HHB12029]|uniref:Uncharacterized protein n=1 Tax=Exidia glandulosa HHB12029 TaxID=1314781 RepID=A0A165HGU0_EXIGL|nr:hypothetical protein EXIGLDRAFT_693187 [Exidia glandulosa HHB12029]
MTSTRNSIVDTCQYYVADVALEDLLQTVLDDDHANVNDEHDVDDQEESDDDNSAHSHFLTSTTLPSGSHALWDGLQPVGAKNPIRLSTPVRFEVYRRLSRGLEETSKPPSDAVVDQPHPQSTRVTTLRSLAPVNGYTGTPAQLNPQPEMSGDPWLPSPVNPAWSEELQAWTDYDKISGLLPRLGMFLKHLWESDGRSGLGEDILCKGGASELVVRNTLIRAVNAESQNESISWPGEARRTSYVCVGTTRTMPCIEDGEVVKMPALPDGDTTLVVEGSRITSDMLIDSSVCSVGQDTNAHYVKMLA